MEKDQHGPDKLYEKFHVYKAKEAREQHLSSHNPVEMVYDSRTRLGADGEFVFVLRPETNDKAAQLALAEYARCCEGSYPELSQGIVRELTRIRARVKAIMQMGDCDEDEAYRVMAEFRSGATDLPKLDG